ncbi:MAG: hypothetical protein V3V29_05930 [Acidimicrobiia bacterium]
MNGSLDGAVVDVRPDIVALFRREWSRLAAPGSSWTGAERVAIASQARAARAGEEGLGGDLPPSAVAAARLLGAVPAQADSSLVETWVSDAGPERYVELLGVVARLAAVDSFHRGVGAEAPPLPDPDPGLPTGEVDPAARRGPAWVPMVGGASIVHALSLVPAESRAQEDMHGPLYLTYEGMQDLVFVGGLTRAQMELVAARTSALNECFY